MTSQERPRLRPYLAAAIDENDPEHILLYDRLGLAERPWRISRAEFHWVRLFDGRRTLHDIHAQGGQDAEVAWPLERLTRLVERLDEALFLDGPRFWERLADPIREPTCIGCYEGEPDALRRQVRGLFTGGRGPGLPREGRPDGRLRAALIPHIDYHRGGHSFAWGFKEVFERTDAELFVIIGTSHYSPARFTLTRKHFKTPLGVAQTDQGYIDRLVAHYGDGLFDDELTHLPEHSIELEVVFLQYLYENRRPIRIVPLLVGPFQDCVEDGRVPANKQDIGRMVEALRQAEAETQEPICYIISGDLAHIGPKFGDPEPVNEVLIAKSRAGDQAILRQAEAADPAGYFRVIAAEGDRRRICGLPPTYTLLEAVHPSRGQILNYDQYVHPRGYESVSFASVAFYR
ncbi:MAG TPA: AmmeMemoRadiSam system protein B [Gemmataceae bacterium]|nr:AmmeMemoRadiSam system protein B [Gemmataceae bacterium]